MKNPVPIELLLPARNEEFGRIAINHGADAVYIGAPKFGARASVPNTIEDIEKLLKYAHFFRAKVYATLNTILFDDELEDALKLIKQLYETGIDGIIIQDMGILEMDLPPVPLIASTQTHNATPEKVSFLEKAGFARVILARELSLQEIANIRNQTSVELESFVHGALCVSYSGQCYMSQTVCGRSGNRGVCAQPCRSAYDLIDSNENIVVKNKNLLSLKDLNLSGYVKDLMNAGITSFKVEGRLKDLNYIKNITTYYRQTIDSLLAGESKFTKSSSGRIIADFTPDPDKTFSRGYTYYNIEGRKEKTASFLTQKSIGKRIGTITKLGPSWFIMDSEDLCSGDGICFFDNGQRLSGTLIIRKEADRIVPKEMAGLQIGSVIYRNHDQAFEKKLKNEESERKIEVYFLLEEWEEGFVLTATDEDNCSASVRLSFPKIKAENKETAGIKIIRQLSKLGETAFETNNVLLKIKEDYFIQAKYLNQFRREVITELERERALTYNPEKKEILPNNQPFPQKVLSYTSNVSNHLARKFYERHGAETTEPAYELLNDYKNKVVMTTKHCIKYQLDACPVHQKSPKKINEPLYIKDNHHMYQLVFDCKNCKMEIVITQ